MLMYDPDNFDEYQTVDMKLKCREEAERKCLKDSLSSFNINYNLDDFEKYNFNFLKKSRLDSKDYYSNRKPRIIVSTTENIVECDKRRETITTTIKRHIEQKNTVYLTYCLTTAKWEEFSGSFMQCMIEEEKELRGEAWNQMYIDAKEELKDFGRTR